MIRTLILGASGALLLSNVNHANACSFSQYENADDKLEHVTRLVEDATWVVIATAAKSNVSDYEEPNIDLAQKIVSPSVIRAGLFGWILDQADDEDDTQLKITETTFLVKEVLYGSTMRVVSVVSISSDEFMQGTQLETSWGEYPIGAHPIIMDCSVMPQFAIGEDYLLIKNSDTRARSRDMEPIANNDLWVETVRVVAKLVSEY